MPVVGLSETHEPRMGPSFIGVQGISVVKRGLPSRVGPEAGA